MPAPQPLLNNRLPSELTKGKRKSRGFDFLFQFTAEEAVCVQQRSAPEAQTPPSLAHTLVWPAFFEASSVGDRKSQPVSVRIDKNRSGPCHCLMEVIVACLSFKAISMVRGYVSQSSN